MKNYKVESMFANRDQIAGIAPHDNNYDQVAEDYTEAEDAEEAIILTMQWVFDQTDSADKEQDEVAGTVTILNDDGEAVGKYYNFRAMELNDDGEEVGEYYDFPPSEI